MSQESETTQLLLKAVLRGDFDEGGEIRAHKDLVNGLLARDPHLFGLLKMLRIEIIADETLKPGESVIAPHRWSPEEPDDA